MISRRATLALHREAFVDPDKLSFIQAYFDDLDEKIDNLGNMAGQGFKDEAMILCLVYIDGMGNQLAWPSRSNARNFVGALREFSRDKELGLVHPLQLVRALRELKAFWHPIATLIEGRFPGPTYELMDEASMLEALSPSLTESQLTALAPELWRGTIAAIAYHSMRNDAVHRLGAIEVSFSGLSYLGNPATTLSLSRLQSAAKQLCAESRRRSLAEGKWFGHDFLTP